MDRGCGCRGELDVGIELRDGSAELEDPDSMEDEDQPYFWNRRTARDADD